MRLFFMSGHGGGGVREHGGRGGVRTCGVSEEACPLARGHPTGPWPGVIQQGRERPVGARLCWQSLVC